MATELEKKKDVPHGLPMATTFETRCINIVNIINAVIKKLQLPGTGSGQLICVGGIIHTSCGRRGTPIGRGFRILRPGAQQVWPATEILSPHIPLWTALCCH